MESSSAPVPAETRKSAEPAEAPVEKGVHTDTHKTMRVAESHIDTFLAYVGELLVVGDMFGHLQNRLAGQELDRDIVMAFRRANETFGALSNSLQRSIMSIRKVSVHSLMQKVPRMVRDIATQSGKDIQVVCEGEDIEVDKSHIDMLDAPLTHMVRNAADHGIEMPDMRRQAGKSSTGLLRVAVSETATSFILSVADDGAGLNYDAIRVKAEAMGLIKQGQALRQEDLVNFIFVSGVSTAKQVTDVSGRGVGMDVVKRMIDDAGGAISIHSERGQGSTFEVTLPKSVTTQIMRGFLVEACNQTYIFSMDKIHETARIDASEINHVADKGRCVVRHGNVLPLVSLRDVLGLPKEDARDQEIVVTVDLRRARFALGVDSVLGVQQVVVRPMEGLTSGSDSIVGGALMGDGSVALIVDLEKLYTEYEGVGSQT
jgi:two-component system chemotaxis sensor kinase CheA